MKDLYKAAETTGIKGFIALDSVFGIAALAGLREEGEQAQLFVDTGATLPAVFSERYASLTRTEEAEAS